MKLIAFLILLSSLNHAYASGFGAETEILTPIGPKKISEIKVGDEVISCNPELECLIGVISRIKKDEQIALEIVTDIGKIILSPWQKIKLNGRFIEADKLKAGNEFVADESKVIIRSINETDEYVNLFSIEVDPFHTFFLANGYLMHNGIEKACSRDNMFFNVGKVSAAGATTGAIGGSFAGGLGVVPGAITGSIAGAYGGVVAFGFECGREKKRNGECTIM